MPDVGFLESYPLYRRAEIKIPHPYSYLRTPAINYWCEQCNSVQTFHAHTDRWQKSLDNVNDITPGFNFRAVYYCLFCKTYPVTFLIRVADDGGSVMKVGQWPPWTIKVDPDLASVLGNHLEVYRRGLICESQGYGIGAFAYYRRIVEETIDSLLSQIEDLIPEGERSNYATALEAAKATQIAKDKIALVKDLLPLTLRPDGMNPLNVLHSTLSAGLHGRPDEDCLEDAEAIRRVLAFLVTQIKLAQKTSLEFTTSMRKLLEKKGGTGN